MTLLKRMALVIDDGVITKVFYPVFPPDKNAEEVIAWLRGVALRTAVQERARRGEHVAEHLRRQHAGIRVVARAVIAHEDAQLADLVRRAVTERRGRAAVVERRQRAVVGNPPERDDGAQLAASRRWSLPRNERQVLISAGVGLFSGGTQRTALVMRASTSVSPSSGRA